MARHWVRSTDECNGCGEGDWSGSTVGNCCRFLSTGIRLINASNPEVAWDPEKGVLFGLFVELASKDCRVSGAALDRLKKRLAVSADGHGCVRWQEPLERHAHGRR